MYIVIKTLLFENFSIFLYFSLFKFLSNFNNNIVIIDTIIPNIIIPYNNL
jgi:hypothetical protein